MTHELKTLHCIFEAVKFGVKTFEVRKDDRGFKVGDTLRLLDLDNGETLERQVCYILPGGQYGLAEDYVVLGLRPAEKTYTIKPLEWEEKGEVHMDFESETLVGALMVYADGKAGRNIPATSWGAAWCGAQWHTIAKDLPTLEEAKQAAWDAYVARMEEALEVVK